MKAVFRSCLFIALASIGGGAQAQGGIRAIIWNVEPVATGINADFLHYGLGYDGDLNDRLSMGVQVRFSPGASSWVVNYQSSYHFSDNESTSFYMGPNVGFRSVGGSVGATLIPVGMRMGVRGGLEGFYADLYVGGLYNIGGGGRTELADVGIADLRTTSFCVGLDLGFGWAGNMGKW